MKALCPICEKPAQKSMHPFCSQRCADRDLGRWLDGKYTIPTEEPPEDDGLSRDTEEE